jgi:GntR family transcriptional regulator
MSEEVKRFPFEKDVDSSVPLWVQLRKRLIYLISTGYFKSGEQLPKIRELASEIEINFNTVNKAYMSLISDGYLESIRGKGVFVRKELYEKQGISKEVEVILDDCLKACYDLGLNSDDVLAQMTLRVRRLKLEEARAKTSSGTNLLLMNTETTDIQERKA